MALANYSDLTNAVADWLERGDLNARIPDFVAIAESRFNRVLKVRQMEARSSAQIVTTVAEPQFIALPSDFQTMRGIRLTSVVGDPALIYRNKLQLDEFRYSIANGTGQPIYFSVYASVIELCPTPDQTYTAEMVYRATIPSLQTNTTNWLMTMAPEAYLYGTLMAAAPYLKDEDRAPIWQGELENAIESLNSLSQDSTFNAGPLTVTTCGVTP